jgi:hypothetical protein
MERLQSSAKIRQTTGRRAGCQKAGVEEETADHGAARWLPDGRRRRRDDSVSVRRDGSVRGEMIYLYVLPAFLVRSADCYFLIHPGSVVQLSLYVQLSFPVPAEG